MRYIQSNLYYFSKNACLLCCLATITGIRIMDIINDYDKLYEETIITNRWELLNIDKFLQFYNKNCKIKIGTFKQVKCCTYSDYIIQCKRYEDKFHYLVIDKEGVEIYNSTEYCKANDLGEIDKYGYIGLEEI